VVDVVKRLSRNSGYVLPVHNERFGRLKIERELLGRPTEDEFPKFAPNCARWNFNANKAPFVTVRISTALTENRRPDGLAVFILPRVPGVLKTGEQSSAKSSFGACAACLRAQEPLG
jgi:hypothetical protein